MYFVNIMTLHLNSSGFLMFKFVKYSHSSTVKFIMKNKILFVLLLTAMSQTSFASETSDEIALLRQQVQLLTERLNKLEAKTSDNVKQQKVLTEKVASNTKTSEPTGSSWANKMSFKADFRDRYEYIDQKGAEIRQRNRVRLRAQFDMQVNKDLGFTLGLATGADDPVSTNQSLDGGFSTKDVRLDLAFFNYQLSDNFSLIGGKMKNPLYKPAKNPILWDGDLNPEGFALNYDHGSIHASFVGFSVEERKAADDTLMFGGQLMHGRKISDNITINAGIGYYDYRNLKGNAPLYNGKNKGNTLDANGNLANDFNTAEIFAEIKSKLAGRPLSVYANYYKNTAADDLDAAYTVGFKYGKVSGSDSWDFGLAYLDTEADALLGTFNDSDFAGGNTDSKGMLLKAGYGIKKNISLGLTYIDSEIGQSQLTQTDYDRLQLDFKIKFK